MSEITIPTIRETLRELHEAADLLRAKNEEDEAEFRLQEIARTEQKNKEELEIEALKVTRREATGTLTELHAATALVRAQKEAEESRFQVLVAKANALKMENTAAEIRLDEIATVERNAADSEAKQRLQAIEHYNVVERAIEIAKTEAEEVVRRAREMFDEAEGRLRRANESLQGSDTETEVSRLRENNAALAQKLTESKNKTKTIIAQNKAQTVQSAEDFEQKVKENRRGDLAMHEHKMHAINLQLFDVKDKNTELATEMANLRSQNGQLRAQQMVLSDQSPAKCQEEHLRVVIQQTEFENFGLKNEVLAKQGHIDVLANQAEQNNIQIRHLSNENEFLKTEVNKVRGIAQELNRQLQPEGTFHKIANRRL